MLFRFCDIWKITFVIFILIKKRKVWCSSSIPHFYYSLIDIWKLFMCCHGWNVLELAASGGALRFGQSLSDFAHCIQCNQMLGNILILFWYKSLSLVTVLFFEVSTDWILFGFIKYLLIRIKDHHQGILTAWILLTLSHHPSLLTISLGKSFRWHPMSAQSWWM